ncbi:putative pentatricopeptide repeat-containing protein At1g77010, mitochondrial [Abrus precatorius]|uniref:Pentatricopeptide repeat-containing protein At1g77010, mitochondrial n=1 Tax=Abrus precatorius TaxID=3816 RepID=A0A8B8M1V9_ABRPR|nr:putative pentatricopeptide repeat-containing protein At1g77010, mitochondrial [Abrus precatorius]
MVLHVAFLKTGILNSSLAIANRLLQLYSGHGCLHDASNLFDEMPHTNAFSWNTLIQAYLNSGATHMSLHLFHAMPHKTHYSWNMVVSSFAKCGHLQLAHSLFNAMPSKNHLVWNSIIHGYSRHGHPRKALFLFKNMNSDPLQMVYRDAFVLATVLGACAELLALNCGKQVHARVFIDGLGLEELDKVLCSSLINLYGKCGDLDSAARVMSFVRGVDDFSLSALISGYANAGRMGEARRAFESKADKDDILYPGS